MNNAKYHVGMKTERKELVELVGVQKANGALLFNWKCLGCNKIYGPSTGTSVFRSEYTKCCPRRYAEKTNYKGYKLITGSKMTQYKDGARRRGLEFSVTVEYLWELWESQEGLCAYTGLPIELNVDASLDRIDSSKGYIEGNVHWVMWKVNRMKLNLPHEEFIQLCSLITGRKGDKNGKQVDA